MRTSPSGFPAIEPPVGRHLPRPNPAVVYCEVEEGAVLLSTQEEAYYGLNRVGAKIWSLLTSEIRTVQDLCAALSAAYPGVSPEDLLRDVIALLDDLVRNRLVVE